MRVAPIAMVVAVILFGLVFSIASTHTVQTVSQDSRYLLIGGQNGTWFEDGQYPKLERVYLSNYSVTNLTPTFGEGAVWTGDWNGSQWLISGYGSVAGPHGSNPYLYLYDGHDEIAASSQDQYDGEASWHGGDVFGISYNGREWLLSGLGSDVLPSFSPQQSNHMSLAVFDGNTFTDLSGELPDQMDAILYANAWNGKLWLIGGGYDEVGELLSYNGSTFEDLTDQVTQAIPTFGSVQSIAWNGDYWLIGGVNFLAKYDGNEFLDLSPELSSAMNWREGWGYSVNAVAWNGVEWMLGGGSPVAQFSDSNAWVASYSSSRFENLSPKLGTTVANDIFQSSVLTIAPTGDSWIIGGYANDHGILYSYRGSDFTQLFNLVSNYTYVNWVGAGSLPNHTDASKVNRSTFDFTSCQLMTNIEKRVHVLLPVML